MKKIFFFLFASLASVLIIAQGQGDDSDPKIDTTGKQGAAWYSSPWVWVVVAAVFILLLVILTPGNKQRDDRRKKDA